MKPTTQPVEKDEMRPGAMWAVLGTQGAPTGSPGQGLAGLTPAVGQAVGRWWTGGLRATRSRDHPWASRRSSGVFSLESLDPCCSATSLLASFIITDGASPELLKPGFWPCVYPSTIFRATPFSAGWRFTVNPSSATALSLLHNYNPPALGRA